MDELKLAIVGLDTSHAIHFPERLQSLDIPTERRVSGMRVVNCMKFMTPFTTSEVLAERTKQLESWGVRVTENFDEAVDDCDAILLEINDPAYHVEYFERAAKLGKPIFLDKPIADTYENGQKIASIAEAEGVRFFTASSLRFVPELQSASADVGKPELASVYGPLGTALAGSSIVWYGVHAFEMLERAMGAGASRVTAIRDEIGVVVTVGYRDGRRGVVELTEGNYQYGGRLRSADMVKSYEVDMTNAYSGLLEQIRKFLVENEIPVPIEESLEIMHLLDAAERSYDSGSPVEL